MNNSKTQGSGIDNIRGRYVFFTDKPVKISNDKTQFIAQIPLLELDTI